MRDAEVRGVLVTRRGSQPNVGDCIEESRRVPQEAAADDLSFDHMSRLQHDRWRKRQAERLRGFQVHRQFESGRLLDRQVTRLRALE